MTRRLVASYVSITLFVLVALEVPLGLVFARAERRNVIAELKHDALALSSLSVDTLRGTRRDDLSRLVRGYSARTRARVVITNRAGVVVADSSSARPVNRSFADRPEIAEALRGREAIGSRHSETVGTDLIYVAVPAASGGQIAGAVRITYTPTVLNALVRRIWTVLAVVGLAVLAAVAAISVLLARSVTAPLRRLEAAATALAGGDLSARADVRSGPPEVYTLAEAFNTMADRLEQLVRSHRDFVADASHQLRTPLQALRFRLENAEASAGGSKKDLRGALAEVARLGRLVDGLLALARAEREAPATECIDISEVVEQRRDTWEPLAAERGIAIRTKLDGDSVRAVASPGHLEQVLDNLISNAVSASPDGGAIDIYAEQSDGWIGLHVADEGPGMSADERARATDRFWRAADAKSGGTGLGLTIVRRLTEVDGGVFELRQRRPTGLDAVVRLRTEAARGPRANTPYTDAVAGDH